MTKSDTFILMCGATVVLVALTLFAFIVSPELGPEGVMATVLAALATYAFKVLFKEEIDIGE